MSRCDGTQKLWPEKTCKALNATQSFANSAFIELCRFAVLGARIVAIFLLFELRGLLTACVG